VNVRKATLGDVQAIFALWMANKAATSYATVPVDRARALKSIRQCISGPQAFARVAVEDDGTIVGVLLGLKEELWFSPREEAKDLLFGAKHVLIGEALLREFCAWAWSFPRVVSVLMAMPYRGSGGAEMFESVGFVREGAVFCLGRHDVEQKVA
jgi:hypothetical protein